jgi:predicted secreted protein
MKFLKYTFLFGIGLTFCSCRLAELKKEAPEVNFLKTGEKFRITLPEDHSKGETWQLKRDENYQAFEDLGTVWHGAEKGVDINLKALSSGQYTLNLIKTIYKDSLDNKQYIVNIKN